MKTGLVLEGGAMRGMFTAGVLDVLYESGVRFDGIIGVSAGAVFGPNFLSGQPGRVIRYNKRFNADPDYMGLRCLLRTGNLINTEYAYYRVPQKLDPFDDAAFAASGVPFYAVLTDLKTGEAAYIQIKSVLRQMEVLRASASMPFVSRPVCLGGRRYLDGGVADSIPFAAMADMGYSRLVVILTRDMDYVKKPVPGLPAALFYRNYPAFRARLRDRHERYNAAVAQLRDWEADGRAFVIRPSRPITIGRMETEPERLQAVYECGRGDAWERLAALHDFLKN